MAASAAFRLRMQNIADVLRAFRLVECPIRFCLPTFDPLSDLPFDHSSHVRFGQNRKTNVWQAREHQRSALDRHLETFTSFRDDRSTVEKYFKPSAKMIDGTDSRLSIAEVHLIECAVKNKHNSKARTFAQVRDSCQRNPEVNEKNCDRVR